MDSREEMYSLLLAQYSIVIEHWKKEREERPTSCLQEIEKERSLVHLLHPHNLLCDVLTRGANPPHRQEDVVVQEIPRQNLEKIE